MAMSQGWGNFLLHFIENRVKPGTLPSGSLLLLKTYIPNFDLPKKYKTYDLRSRSRENRLPVVPTNKTFDFSWNRNRNWNQDVPGIEHH